MSQKENIHEIDLGFDAPGFKGHFFVTGNVHRIVLKEPILLLSHRYHDDEPVAYAAYEVELEDGSILKGELDDTGQAEILGLNSRPLRVRYGLDPRPYEIVDDGANPAYIAHFTKADADKTAKAGGTALSEVPGRKNLTLEAVDWVWGTLRGGFNEKQSVSQIIVDAVIGMVPLVGDVTAVRDILALVLGMAQDPKKRESKLEWAMLAVLLFALLPVIGGAVKGVGKLLLRAGRQADDGAKLLRDMVAVLNRLGMGDSLTWLKNLDLESYTGEVLGCWRDLTRRLDLSLDACGKRFNGLLPKRMLDHLARLKEKVAEVAKKGESMLPDALTELNERLKAAQRQLYQGEWHAVPKSLQAATREVEARLVDVPGGKKWVVEGMHFPPNGRESFIKRDGWPDLSEGEYVKKVKGTVSYRVIPCFSGPMRAVHIPPGTKIYRVVEKNGIAVGDWWVYSMPESGREWREGLAVLDSWNKDGYFVEITVPEGGLFAWEGKAASQIENAEDAANTMGQYLPGGQIQLFIDLKFRENAKAMEALSRKLDKPPENILEKRPTPWTDPYNGLHVPPKEAEAAILGPFEIESKNRLPAAVVEKGTRRSRKEEQN